MAKMATTAGVEVEILMRDLVGKTVITLRTMSNGYAVVPASARAVVDGTWQSGVSLVFEGCQHCGVKVRMSKVHRNDVALVEE